MAKNKLFEEAIADAKAMREAALANAKLALEESITPRLQSMISAKLQEADDEELDEAQEEEMDESLDQFLSELEDGESDMQDRAPVDEADEEGTDTESDSDEDTDDETGTEDGDEATDDLEAEDVKISDLSIEEFKDIIRSVVQDEMGGAHGEPDGDEGAEMGGAEDFGAPEMGGGEDQDVNLDELLADLDGLNENDDEDLDEATTAKGIISAKKRPINGINAKGGNADKGSSASGYKSAPKVAVTKQLEEATKTVRILSKELKEVNLLNAKLLFVNKLFEGNNLNESQKLRVIESFDKAATPKQAKLVYETLKGELKNKKKNNEKKNLKESLNFASRAVGSTKSRNPIVEDSTVERFKKLANIK